MIRGSLQRRLFLLVVLVTIPVFTVHEGIEIRSMIRAASEHTEADTRDVAAAAIPMLKSTLIVDDLATAQETMDNIMRQGHFLGLRLLAPDGVHVLVEARPVLNPSAERAPAWFANWLDLRFAAQQFPIEAGGTRYGTLVAEPSSQYLVATIWELIWMAIVFWLATLTATLMLLRFTLRRSLRPLEELADAARQLGEGNLESRAPVGDMSELAETAIAFNRMADNLASARAQLEERVRQATRDLENLITRIPAGVYKLRISPDDSMRFDYVSPRWCELLELDADALHDDPKAPMSRVHPDEIDGFIREFDLAKAGQTHFQWEGRLRDGMRASWLRIEAMPTLLDNGDVLWEGIQYDVSARKQAEEALRTSEEKLRGLYELSPLGIALTDRRGRYIEFNEAFRAICGYSADELRQLDYWTLTPRIYEADEQRQLEALRLTGRYGPYEKEYRRKDGQLVPLSLNGMLVKVPDGQDLIWSIVEDITEKKRNEADRLRLYQAVTHASEAFLICDPQYRVQYVNPSFEQLFGYTLEEIRGQPITSLLPDDTGLATTNPVALGEFSGERLRRAKDGRLIPVLLKVSHIVCDDGVNAGYVGTMTDLTVVKTAEAALKNTLRELDNLINRIPAGVYKLRHGADGRLHFDLVSRRWCEILEIEEAEVYHDPMAAFTRIHPDDLDGFLRLNDACLASQTPCQWEGRLRDGMRVRWVLSLAPMEPFGSRLNGATEIAG
jgi:PAS domain S-box-containing protein